MNDNNCSIYNTWPLYLSVVLLILNDHYLKLVYPGWLTGKLSDFSGIFLILLFLRSIFPRHMKTLTSGVIVFFVFWKSPYSQPMIDSINEYSPLKTGRLVDYTDLAALIMVPVANYVIENRQKYRIRLNIVAWMRVPLIIVSVLAITGTSVMMPYQKYSIRKENKKHKIDRSSAIYVIKKVAEEHDLSCVECSSAHNKGEFKNSEITLMYSFSENNRGIEFEIFGTQSGLIFENNSKDEMDVIKHKLKNMLGSTFSGMEFVVKLPEPVVY